MNSGKFKSGDLFPTLDVRSSAGEPVAIARPADGRSWLLLLVYRGRHCPLCTQYLETLTTFTARLAAAGIEVIALSADSSNQLTAHLENLNLDFPVHCGLTESQMAMLGLYRSEPRSAEETDHVFPEPGLFVVNANGQTQIVDIANNPFTRPDLEMLVSGLEWLREGGDRYQIGRAHV